MKLEFKKAAAGDAVVLLEMMKEFYPHEQLLFDEKKLKTAFLSLTENPSLGDVWFILSGEVIGYFVLTYVYSLEYGGKNALLDELFIKEQYRGKGFGRQTLKFIEEHCSRSGVHAVHLQVMKFNPDAKKLYELSGYEEVDRIFMTKIITADTEG